MDRVAPDTIRVLRLMVCRNNETTADAGTVEMGLRLIFDNGGEEVTSEEWERLPRSTKVQLELRKSDLDDLRSAMLQTLSAVEYLSAAVSTLERGERDTVAVHLQRAGVELRSARKLAVRAYDAMQTATVRGIRRAAG